MKKADLRKTIGERLRQLTPKTRRDASVALCGKLVARIELRTAETVLLFAPQESEPDLDLLWEFPEVSGKRLVYPRVAGNALELHAVRALHELQIARWNLREPVANPATLVRPEEIDVAIVPGVAFSPSGARLGRGGGYYDRLLAETPRAHKIGVCFGFQWTPDLPTEPHDVPMDTVLTHDSTPQ